MDKLLAIWRRLTSLGRRGKLGRELEEEMQHHVEMKARDLAEKGMNEDDARWAARRAFGNRALAMEDSRGAWSFVLIETVMQDLKYGFRTLLRNPTFTAAIVLTLALGIGANTAMFTLVDSVLLRYLPVSEPERLFKFGDTPIMGQISSDRPEDRNTRLFSFHLYNDLRRHNEVFADLAAISSYPINAYVGSEGASSGSRVEKVEARLVTGNFFPTLGIGAFQGRVFSPEDDEVPGGHPVVVLSHAFWSRRFGQDRNVVGRSVLVNGAEYTILGVMPREFFGVSVGRSTDIWVPMMMQAELERAPRILDEKNDMWLRVFGRLKPKVTATQAEERTNELFHRLLEDEAGSEITPEVADAIDELNIDVAPFAKGFAGLRYRLEKPLLILMGVVGLVLLIACANVGNLLLARASGRKKEVALRLALGSGRGRLLRQLLTESLVLALLGGAVGLLLARWTMDFLPVLISTRPTPVPIQLALDSRVMLFTLLVSTLTALVFGLAPALRATKVDLTSPMKTQGLQPHGGRDRWNLRKTLVVSQVAVSLLLLIGAGLFLRSFQNLLSEETGFQTEGVLLVTLDPQGGGYTEEQLPNLYRDLVDRIEAIPETRSASLSYFHLFAGTRWVDGAYVNGFEPQSDRDSQIEATLVTPGYFETVGIPVVRGRGFEPTDREGAPKVAVVNETFARHYFGNESPVGKRFGQTEESTQEYEIVGMVGDLTYHHFREETPRYVYFPVLQTVDYLSSLEVLTAGDPAAIVPQVRRAIEQAEPNLPILEVKTLVDQVHRSLRQDQSISRLTGFFGLLALLLASIGLYGIMAYGVVQRTNEIGIRVALGAHRGKVLWLVLREGMILVALGVVLGIPIALGASQFLSSLLFGLSAWDPVTIAGATLVLLLVAIFAGYLPARRATRLDPVRALRYE